jgi:hypothetical protein
VQLCYSHSYLWWPLICAKTDGKITLHVQRKATDPCGDSGRERCKTVYLIAPVDIWQITMTLDVLCTNLQQSYTRANGATALYTLTLMHAGIKWPTYTLQSMRQWNHNVWIAGKSGIHEVLQFSPVSIIPPLLHTHSSICHSRCIMFFSQYFSFPLSVSFHHCSILIHSSTTHV